MRKLLLYLLLILVLPVQAHAWNSYKTDDYNSGYSQSWNQYKIDNQIQTQVQKSWFSNFAEGVGNFFTNVKDFSVNAFVAIKDFAVNVYDSIKNIFVKTPETDAGSLDPGMQTKEFNVSLDNKPLENNNESVGSKMDTTLISAQEEDSALVEGKSVAGVEPNVKEGKKEELVSQEELVINNKAQDIISDVTTDKISQPKDVNVDIAQDTPIAVNAQMQPKQVVMPVNPSITATPTPQPNLMQKTANFFVGVKEGLRKKFFPTPQERFGKLINKIENGSIDYDPTGDKPQYGAVPTMQSVNYQNPFAWKRVEGYPKEFVDRGDQFVGVMARYSVGGDFGVLDDVHTVAQEDDGSYIRNISDHSGNVLSSSGKAPLTTASNVAAVVQAANSAITTTMATGEGIYFLHYKKRPAFQEKWYVTSAKSVLYSKGIVKTENAGPVLSEEEALKKLGIQRRDR